MTTNQTAPPGLATVAGLWPEIGRRKDAYLALAGGLLRSGWSVDQVEDFIIELADATNDSDCRIGIARSTDERLKNGEPTSGWPKLAEILSGGWPAVATIKHALGLCAKLEELAAAKRLPLDFLKEEGLHDLEKGGIGIPYLDAGGKILAVKSRLTLDSSSYRWPKGQRVLAYGEHRLSLAADAGYLILCEGETDPLTLWLHGEPALGLPGSATVNRTLQNGHVGAVSKVFVVQEPGQGGQTFVDSVRHRLGALGWHRELRRIQLNGFKDPSALHCDDPEQFKARWQDAMDAADALDIPLPAVASAPVPSEVPWPEPPAEEAFYGLAGDVVRTLEPASEADPVALLDQILTAFGNVVGRSAHCRVEADLHYANESSVLVGRTSKARKGTSWGRSLQLLKAVDSAWADERVQSGVSSGEGIIWAVRDPILKRERIKERGEPVRYEEIEADPGISDKRLLVMEPEFAGVLKHLERQGNIVSPVLRQAWESGDLRTLTKNNPARATGAHISMIGHITVEELRRYLTASEQANGFGNRILWLCVRRSKELPEGGTVDAQALLALQQRITQALAFARQQGEMQRDEGARELWRAVYGQLSADRPGLAGAMVGRAEAHVLRLSLIYALLDQSPVIQAPHLLAALTFWDYCERSVQYIFGDSTGDSLADELLMLIRAAPDGITRWEMSNALGRHQSADRIGRALALLARLRRIQMEKVQTGGRSEERWRAVKGVPSLTSLSSQGVEQT